MAEKEEEEIQKQLKNELKDYFGNNDIENAKNILTSINNINDISYLFLHNACHHGNKEIVELLLDNGAKCDFEDDNGVTPLHYACIRNENSEIVEILLKRGSIDLSNQRNRWQRTPLHIASYNGDKKVVEVLLRYGASLTLRDKWGNTPLDDARNRWDGIVLMINKEEERRRNVGYVGCHLLRATRAISGFINIPPEIVRVVLSFFDEDRVLSEKQVKDVIDFGFDFTSLSNNIVPDNQQFISQMKLEF